MSVYRREDQRALPILENEMGSVHSIKLSS